MKLTDRINELFTKFNVKLQADEVNLEAQAVLENGTVVYTDAASFVEGADVFVINEEGERIPLPDGEYTFENGDTLRVANGGKVAQTISRGADTESEGRGGENATPSKGGTPPAAKKKAPPAKPAAPAKKKKSEQDKLAEGEAVVEDWAGMEKRIQNLEDGIADIKARLDEKSDVIDAEEVEEVEEKKEDIEMSEVEKLRKEITELKTQAASKGVERVKKQEATFQPVDLTSLSNDERITALFNQFNK